MTRKYLSTLGLAARAGKLAHGTPKVCESLKEGKAFLVVEASGNSDNTRKRLSDRSAYYGVRLIEADADRIELGRYSGRPEGTAAVAILDKGLATAVAAGWDSREKE